MRRFISILVAMALVAISCTKVEYITPVIYPDLPPMPWIGCKTLPATDINYISATLNGEAYLPTVDTIIVGKDTTYRPIDIQPFDVQIFYSQADTTEEDLINNGTAVRTTLLKNGPFSVKLKDIAVGAGYNYVVVLDAYTQRKKGGVVSFTTLSAPEGSVDLGGDVFWATENYGVMSKDEFDASATIPWALPTNSQLQYISGDSVCTAQLDTVGGVPGYRSTNPATGKSIFLPFMEDGTFGYWSRDESVRADSAYYLKADSLGYLIVSERPRVDSLSVRLVFEKY